MGIQTWTNNGKKWNSFLLLRLWYDYSRLFFLVVDDVPFDLLLLKGCKGYHGVIASMLCNIYCKSKKVRLVECKWIKSVHAKVMLPPPRSIPMRRKTCAGKEIMGNWMVPFFLRVTDQIQFWNTISRNFHCHFLIAQTMLKPSDFCQVEFVEDEASEDPSQSGYNSTCIIKPCNLLF